MKKPMQQREIIIPFCEGEAEINLFAFLKLEYSNGKMTFKNPIDLGGFSDLKVFKRKYKKRIREQELKPARAFKSVKFLFIFGNDLVDSIMIKNFLEKEKHFVQLCNPNTEGLLLSIVGKFKPRTVNNKDYRNKCKTAFKDNFGCEAHKLKREMLKKIFASEDVFKKNLPVLHGLFSKK